VRPRADDLRLGGTMWAEVDPHATLVVRHFRLLATMNDVPPDATHVASFCDPTETWHLYEVPAPV
jgi:hypothetical protein